jgi:fatty acid desaturase
MNQTAYLDFQDIFVNELVGDIWLFAVLGFVLLWIFGLKAKIPMQGLLVLSVIWVGVLFSSATAGLEILWILLVLMVGVTFYFIVMRGLER